jgi:hypothetical protein
MTDDKKAEFLPFHAINQFMRNDYRLTVIRSALLALPGLDRKFSAPIDRLTKKLVQVPGFRNSAKAPARIKAIAMVNAFEKSPDLVAAILAAWGEAQIEFRQQVYDFLTARDWKLLPPEADRTKLPGFLTVWPAGEDYETLYEAFIEAFPDNQPGIDDLSLMVVWLSGRLPYQKAGEEEPGEELNESSE